MRSSASASHDRDLVEFDFGAPLGRSPSGSLASSESPSRSRASSFGGAARAAGDDHHGHRDGHRGPSPHTTATPARALTSPSEKPSDVLIADYLRKQTSLAEELTPPSNIDSADYVLAEAPSSTTTVVHAVVEPRPRFVDDDSATNRPSDECDYEMMNCAENAEKAQNSQNNSRNPVVAPPPVARQHSSENAHPVQLRQQSTSLYAAPAPQLSVRTSGMFETIVEASSGKSSRKSSTSSLTPSTPTPAPPASALTPEPKETKSKEQKHSPIVRLITTLTSSSPSPKQDRKKSAPAGSIASSSGSVSAPVVDDDYAPMIVGKSELEPPSGLPKRGSVPMLQCQTSVPDALIAARTQPNSPAVVSDELNYACLQLTPSGPSVSSLSHSPAPPTPSPHKDSIVADTTDYAVVDAAKCQVARKHSRSQLSPR